MNVTCVEDNRTFNLRVNGVIEDDALPAWGRIQLINKTGAPSVKGTAVNIDTASDGGFIAATNPYVVTGFVAENGVPDGHPTWITTVPGSKATFILEDGYAAAPNDWVRLSPTTAGRCITQDMPGLDFPATSITYDTANGVTISGTIADTRLNNGVKLTIGGTTGAPSIDARVIFTGVTETPTEIRFNGYFGANRAAGVTISIWDYVAGGGSWVLIDTLAAAGTTDVTVISAAITADMINAGEMRVRLYGADAGVAGDRLYVDQVIFRSDSDTEHFKEVGHCLTTAAAGTNVTAELILHFL